MDYRIISIGALSHHELWKRQGELRTPHATTTLIRSGDRCIIVDPGLPAQVIAARLMERAGLEPADITDVFLTCFRPSHRWGLAAFEQARWLIFEQERELVGRMLIDKIQNEENSETREALAQEVAILKRFEAAPDTIAEHVDLFPMPGYTPGTCGLLLLRPYVTTLVAGDAVPTIEHLEQGRVLRGAYDVKQAQTSLLEALEIADGIIPGHDNIILNPSRR